MRRFMEETVTIKKNFCAMAGDQTRPLVSTSNSDEQPRRKS